MLGQNFGTLKLPVKPDAFFLDELTPQSETPTEPSDPTEAQTPDSDFGFSEMWALGARSPRCSYHDYSRGRELPQDTPLSPNRLLHEYGKHNLNVFLKGVERAPRKLRHAVREKRERDLSDAETSKAKSSQLTSAWEYLAQGLRWSKGR
ncbi:unnamed protein product [Effrenium voratum]|uniref:Uncharacterized protein n=1 Tax=Effrenium voratum TaxID=2562239 RepID=A0AA36ITH5_9DINO|nr:unnamed protein product [Effrenium voratum]CAJ1392428.1 unnamed protein product [Effrenium voratum]CAJ1444160.1 unnamed protein product [Effrenium voratum]|mmetsp:Transcript_69924/g.166938  ORF Transcript_69924/g.166938 Transcript_69924/m.166938 type:complete len:149 (+) Transcript_69924:72-518(+)